MSIRNDQPPPPPPPPMPEAEDAPKTGAWKVAYADFMTALMAFFLLMWILATTDEAKLSGLANYFAPSIVEIGGPGGDGALGGTAPMRRGVSEDIADEPVDRDAQTEAHDAAAAVAGGASGNPWARLYDPGAPGATERGTAPGAPLYAGTGRGLEETFAELHAAPTPEQNARQLDALPEAILEDLRADPALADLADNLRLERVEDGLVVQIMDRQGQAMFASGSARFQPEVAALVTDLASRIAALPNAITITGHTDAVPFEGRAEYGNWELSADRANATRRLLLEAGVSAERIAGIAGRADTQPLLPDDPEHPSNRRIEVHLSVLDAGPARPGPVE